MMDQTIIENAKKMLIEADREGSLPSRRKCWKTAVIRWS